MTLNFVSVFLGPPHPYLQLYLGILTLFFRARKMVLPLKPHPMRWERRSDNEYEDGVILPHEFMTFLSFRGEGFFLPWQDVPKGRQRRSRHFAVLTYSMYDPHVKMAAALLSAPF